MITDVPAVAPVTMPDEGEAMVALLLLLLHVPPGVASLRVVVSEGQTVAVPVMAEGKVLTVTMVVAKHVLARV